MSVLSAGGSTLSPNNLNLLEQDAYQVSSNIVAQVASEGQGTDENSISAPPSTSVEFVDVLDEVAPMSIPVEFRPHSISTSTASDSKATIENIDSVAPQSVPAELGVTGPGGASNYYNPAYSKYQYKFQMTSDGNPITTYYNYNYNPPTTVGDKNIPVWNTDGQFTSGGSYGPSIQLHPKWPNLHYLSPELDQFPSEGGYHSYTIMPPPPPPPPPLVSPFLQQSQMQGPFAPPERKKTESYNVFLDPPPDGIHNSNSTLNTSSSDNKTNLEQQVTMHHLSSDGELTILKVGPKEDSNKNEINDDDKIISDENFVNESNINEIETEDDGKDDNNDNKDDDVGNAGETISSSDFSDSLDSPDPKADQTKYIVLQKLPNGGAIDLENMQTYTMEDLASDIKNNNNNINDMEKPSNFTYDRPRSFQKSLDDPLVAGEKGSSNETSTLKDEDETTIHPDFIPPAELVISERPPVLPEVYEPLPLSQLDDLEAMSSSTSDQTEEHPVYIIYEQDLFQGEEEHEIAENLANLELLKVASNDTRDEKLIEENNVNKTMLNLETLIDNNQLEGGNGPKITNPDQIGPSEIPKVVWTPIPTQDTREWESPTRKASSPVIGPAWPPPEYKPASKEATLDPVDIGHLSKVAYVTLTDDGGLSQEVKAELNRTLDQDERNIQLLPPRLSAALMHVNNQNRLRSIGSGVVTGRQSGGLSRENKIAPVFKYDMFPDYGRALPLQQQPQQPQQPRQLLSPSPTPQTASTRPSVRPSSNSNSYTNTNTPRIGNGRSIATGIVTPNPIASPKYFQAQMVHGSHKYIPLHLRSATPAGPQPWWQPLGSNRRIDTDDESDYDGVQVSEALDESNDGGNGNLHSTYTQTEDVSSTEGPIKEST